ncbi:Tn3 family transposase [Streptomyces inhibens]|uniref:Tn3 family transposase n=1 Tax=Streptomyces inhibens TaxID=2293571 RepID=UPI0037993CC0
MILVSSAVIHCAAGVLGQAFAEYGRIGKTLHLLQDSESAAGRRPGGRHLPAADESAAHRSGARHKLARDICHGKRGQIVQAYRSAREVRLDAVGLVLNAVVLWTPRNLDAAVEALRALPADERDTRATSWTRTSPGCPRSSTPTSTSWAATSSAPLSRRVARCGPCVSQRWMACARTTRSRDEASGISP